MIASRSARPALLGAVLITAGGLGWYCFLPASAAAALASAAVLNVLMALIFALTIVVFFLLYLGPYRNPGWLSPGFAGSLCLFGIAAFAPASSSARRSASRSWCITWCWAIRFFAHGGPETAPERLPARRRLDQGLRGQALSPGHCGRPDRRHAVAQAAVPRPLVLGKTLFLYHCNDCHAAAWAIRPWDRSCRVGRGTSCRPASSTSTTICSCRRGAARPRRPG